MREELTTQQCFLATVHRVNEAVLLVEVTRHDLLHQLIRIVSLPSGGLGKFGFEFG